MSAHKQLAREYDIAKKRQETWQDGWLSDARDRVIAMVPDLLAEHTAVCRERDEHKQIAEGFHEEWDHTRTRAIELERERDEARTRALRDILSLCDDAQQNEVEKWWDSADRGAGRVAIRAVRARVDAELQRLAPKEAQPKREEEADGK